MAVEAAHSDILQQLGVSYPQLIDYSSRTYTATLVQVGALVLITWDYITTFDGEVAFFWQAERRSRWSVARILFMLNRYFPIIVFSINVYWRVNQSVDNPLCAIRAFMTYGSIAIFANIELLQVIRVWSLYSRSWRAGLVLLALVVCGIIATTLAWTLPSLRNQLVVQLAPESLEGCQYQNTKGFFTCLAAAIVQTIIVAMIFFKVRRSWNSVGGMPLFRALALDGAIYYCVFMLAFGLDAIASRDIQLYIPIVDTHSALCTSVIACNHLMLYLREVASRPIPTEPPSYSLSRPTTTDVTSTTRDSETTYSYDDRSQTVPLRKYHAQNLERKLGTSHELQPSSRFTSQVSPEMD